MIKFVILFLIFTISLGFAKTSLMDLEWKKIELEKVLSERIKNLLLNESVEGISIIDVQIQLDKDSFSKVNEEKKSGIKFSGNSNFTPMVKFDLENDVIETNKNISTPEVDIDIYKYISSINVAIYIDTKVQPEKKDLVLTFLKNNFSNYSGVQINYDFKEAISSPKKPIYLDPRTQDYALYVLISILGISALIFASRILFKGFQSVASSFDRINDGMQSARMKEEEVAEGKDSTQIEMTKMSFKKYEGIKKFKELLDQNPEEAASVLKGWLNSSGTFEKTSIYMLTRHLGMEDLQKLYKFMGHRFRYRLGKFKHTPKDSDFVQADAFLQEQLSSFVLLGERLKDNGLKCHILESSDEIVRKIVENNTEAGAYLLSFLSPAHSSRVVRELKEDAFMKIMSTVIDQDMPESIAEDLKSKLSSLNEPLNRRLPLIFENIEEHLSQANPQREQAIFKMAIDYLEKDQLIEIGLKFFPVFLCAKFSAPSMYTVLLKMAPKDKINFLFIQEDGHRNSLLDHIGKPGSKARDVIEVDLHRILENQELQIELRSRSDKIWYTFAQSARKILSINPKMNKEAHEILLGWIDGHRQHDDSDSDSGAMAA